MREISKVDYDSSNDILYILFANDMGSSYCEELTDGIEEMKDMVTDEPTGLMIYYPCRYREKRQDELKKIGFPMNLAEMCQ